MPDDPISGSEDQYTEFFRQLEQQILDNYPNPKRLGCFTPEELKELVHHPGRFDLKDKKYLHLFRCAECTRDIKAFRQEFERELADGKAGEQGAPSSSVRDNVDPPPQRKSRVSYLTLFATALASLCVGGFLVWVSMRPQSTGLAINGISSSQTAEVLDLSVFTSTRGGNTPANIVMIRGAGIFIIELPPLSPAGKYHVAVVGAGPEEKVSSDGTARSVGGRLELPVTLSLTSLRPGQYRLAIRNEADSAPYYYAAAVR